MEKSILNVKIKKLIRKTGPAIFNTPQGAASKCLESGHVFALLLFRKNIFVVILYYGMKLMGELVRLPII